MSPKEPQVGIEPTTAPSQTVEERDPYKENPGARPMPHPGGRRWDAEGASADRNGTATGTPRPKGLPRKQPLKRSARLRSTTPIRSVNPDRSKKRRQSYVTKLQAYRRSETYRIVAARAGGRCEYEERHYASWPPHAWTTRCPETAGLEHHHRRYPLQPGGEKPEDMLVVCKAHHALIESQQFPHRRRGAA